MLGEEQQSASSSHRGRRVPHYALKTATAIAHDFANREQDIIRQSFSTGNHTWMKEALPVELGPDAVNLLRRRRMERNRLAEPEPQTWSKMTQVWGNGYYQEFEYMPDEYSAKTSFDQGLRSDAQVKREKISHHDWRYSSQERRLKHETLIKDPRNKETYPYLGGDKDAELQLAKQFMRTSAFSGSGWSQESSTGGFGLTGRHFTDGGSFLAGRGSGLEDNSRSSRMTLPDMVRRLQKRLDEDWTDSTVVVSVTDQELVQVAFHMPTVDSERGVQAYMNVLAKDPEYTGVMGLRKVSQLWGMRRDFGGEGIPEDGVDSIWMFFLLMPKWVRMRPTDAYYTVHPRSEGSAFRMSTAGSSVLLSIGSSVMDASDAPKRRPGEGRPGDSVGFASISGSSPLAAASPPTSASSQHPGSARGAGMASTSGPTAFRVGVASSGAYSARGSSAPGGGRGATDLRIIEAAVSTLPALKN